MLIVIEVSYDCQEFNNSIFRRLKIDLSEV